MEIFPAIDIKGGQVVRLTQGDYDKVDVYSREPAAVAAEFRDKGARNLHMVDLDGARDGAPVNEMVVRAIVRLGGLFTQIGGGIRDEDRIKRYLDLGVDRVILGTAATGNFAFLCEMVARYGKQIAVGVDAKDGKVAVEGWRKILDKDASSFCKELENAGVSTIIYTDIARDGMGQGANLDAYRTLCGQVNCDIIASGGVSRLEEFPALMEAGCAGAIVGKALYTGKLVLEEVLAQC